MNPLVRKEVRSILPAWLLAMVLAIVPVWIFWPGTRGATLGDLSLPVFAPFALGVLVLSLTPFGQELNWGTLNVLLAQPVSRQRLWFVKTLVLGLGLLIVFVALLVSNHVRVDSLLETMKHTVWRNAFERTGNQTQFFMRFAEETRRGAWRDSLLIGGLVAFAGCAGGLWTTLLLRQVAGAFWLTLIVPLGLALLVGKITMSLPEPFGQWGITLVILVYCVIGVISGKRLFLQAQDTQWTGGDVFLRGWPASATGRASQTRSRKIIRALLGKELQAQQINLLMALGLGLLQLGVMGFRKWNSEYLATHRSLAMTLEAFPSLWLVIPLLLGSVALAEERKLGTLGSALCSPASRRLQFAVKFLVTVGLSVVCAGVIPLLLELVSISLGLQKTPSTLFGLGEARPIPLLDVWAAAGVGGLAFYGSSLARSSLQAIAAGLVAITFGCLLIVAGNSAEHIPDFLLWQGNLVGLIGWPILTFATLRLAYRNFQTLAPDAKTVLHNLFGFLLAILATALVTTTLYHRAWEAWLPEEPIHRSLGSFYEMQQNGRSTAKIQGSGFQTAVVLTDGRLWLKQAQARLLGFRRGTTGSVRWFTSRDSHSGFAPGSDWKDLALTWNEVFAIKTDGSLWNLSPEKVGEITVNKVGKDQGWESISAGLQHFCARKADGTLWQWGHRYSSAHLISDMRSGTPVQVGEDNDWLCVSSGFESSIGFKADGNVWRWSWAKPKQRLPEMWLTGPPARPVSIAFNDQVVACVCENGTLWLGYSLTNSSYDRLISPELARRASREMVRWGGDSDWKQISFVGWGRAVGLKRDNSLWIWNLNMGFGTESRWVVTPFMPSQYSDWMGAGSDNNAFLALASDGSLCLWGDPEASGYLSNGSAAGTWLMPSRIKARRIADFSP